MPVFYATLLSLFVCNQLALAADPLPSFQVDKNRVSISGVSSGGFMAVQMGVAYSSIFKGVGSVAGGIFWCAKGDSRRAQTVCMNQPDAVRVEEHSRKAQEWEQSGAIDPLANLAQQKIYFYASPQDFVIKPLHSDKLNEFYLGFTDAANIKFEKTIKSAHGFPTLDHGNNCQMGFSPWILKCGYDTAGEMLQHFHSPLAPKGTFTPEHLKKFSQTEFDRGGFFFPEGWIYVPESCARGESCGVHIALHGCQMNPEYIQDQFARFGGYNEWAETNHLIILYPQSAKRGSQNPYACWDWFGFSGPEYSTQNGVQMKALKQMLERLSR